MRQHPARLPALSVPWLRTLAAAANRLRPSGTSIRAAALLLALVSVLASAIPFDHLTAHAREADADQTHELHCHVTPGDCSEAPVSSGPGQFLLGDPLLVLPALLAVLVIAAAPSLSGLATRPRLRPPVA